MFKKNLILQQIFLMYLKSIEIYNFRGIKELIIDDFKSVNLFLGRNNIGKTSVLEAIFISLAPNNPSITVTIDNIRSLLYNQADDFRNTFYMLDYQNQTRILSQYEQNEMEKELLIKPKSQSSTPLVSANDASANFPISTGNKGQINGLTFQYSYKKKHSKKETYVGSIEFENNTFRQTPARYKESISAVIITSSTVLTSISERFGKVLEAKKEGEVIKFLKKVDGSIQGLILGFNNMILVDTGFGRRYPINLLGDGVIKLLAILLAIYDTAGNGIVLVDEINNGLHFTALKALWQAIFSSAKENNVQIFATTHDYETLKHLRAVLEEEDYNQFQDEVRSYTLRKLPDGCLKAYKYNFDELDAAIDQDIEIR